MRLLSNEEMCNVNGGGIKSKLIWGIVGGITAFVIGVIDGIVNPKKCNN